MKKILITSLSFTVLLLLALILSLRFEPILPYVSIVEASSKDLDILTRELKTFNKHTSNKILKEGNYPITIDFQKFEGEDVDNLGYANVSNNICDIKLNLSEKWNKTKLRLVLFHEIGHCFGLEHNAKATIMEAEYSDDAAEMKSLPIFYTEILDTEKTILVSQTGNTWVDEKLNDILDRILPETKDSLGRKDVTKRAKSSFKFKANDAKKMNYEDVP